MRLDVSAEAPIEEIHGLVAALPQGKEDCNATGRDGDHKGQHDHEAEVGLAPHGASGQRQQWPHHFAHGEGDDGTDPDLQYRSTSACRSSASWPRDCAQTVYICGRLGQRATWPSHAVIGHELYWGMPKLALTRTTEGVASAMFLLTRAWLGKTWFK